MPKLRSKGVKGAVDARDVAVRRRPGPIVGTGPDDDGGSTTPSPRSTARSDQARAELEELVRIPSISADPDRRDDVRASADATAELLRAHGLEIGPPGRASTARIRT